MSKTLTGNEPINPCEIESSIDNSPLVSITKHPGMTLRQYYAGQALAGLLANGEGPAATWISDLDMKPVCDKAVECADALITALNTNPVKE